MANQKWSEQNNISSPTITTKLCAIDGATPSNVLIKPSDLGLISQNSPTINDNISLMGQQSTLTIDSLNANYSEIKLTNGLDTQLSLKGVSDGQSSIFSPYQLGLTGTNFTYLNSTGGLYLTSGNDKISLSANSVERMFIDASGNTAIGLTGSTTPKAKLHICNVDDNINTLLVESSYKDNGPFMINSSGNVYIGYSGTTSGRLNVQGTTNLIGSVNITSFATIENTLYLNSNISSSDTPTTMLTGTLIVYPSGYVTGITGTNFNSFAIGDSFIYDDGTNTFEVPILEIYSDSHIKINFTGTTELTGSSNEVVWINPELCVRFYDSINFKNYSTANTFTFNSNIIPLLDNFHTLGNSSNRWKEIYSGTGVINTSDARLKTEIIPFTNDELNASKQLAKEIGTYRFIDAIKIKNDSARKHIGMTVQRAIEIMKQNNLDPFAYGFICYNKWDDEVKYHVATETKEEYYEIVKKAGDIYSFRYDELLAFITRGFEERLVLIENKLSL